MVQWVSTFYLQSMQMFAPRSPPHSLGFLPVLVHFGHAGHFLDVSLAVTATPLPGEALELAYLRAGNEVWLRQPPDAIDAHANGDTLINPDSAWWRHPWGEPCNRNRNKVFRIRSSSPSLPLAEKRHSPHFFHSLEYEFGMFRLVVNNVPFLKWLHRERHQRRVTEILNKWSNYVK